MNQLILASLIWGFSFGLIKHSLAGLNPAFVAAVRLGLSFLVFLPFLKLPRKRSAWGHYLVTGALEYGLMYTLYLSAFQYLAAWQVALFTVFTPIEVALVASLYRKDWKWSRLWGALLSVGGAALLSFRAFEGETALQGFLLIQGANLCFAIGQVHHVWTHRTLTPDHPEHRVFAWEYLGGVLIAAPLLFLKGPEALPDMSALSIQTLSALFYSGTIASGLGFYLWNRGAGQVNAGVLAAMNNLKAPLAMGIAFLVFGENADLPKLGASILLLALGAYTAQRLEKSSQLLNSKTTGQ
jgi:drug/metabolite transporter (DMT)-like permease